MPVNNRISDYHEDMSCWRRDIHAHPELAFEETRTMTSTMTSSPPARVTGRSWWKVNYP